MRNTCLEVALQHAFHYYFPDNSIVFHENIARNDDQTSINDIAALVPGKDPECAPFHDREKLTEFFQTLDKTQCYVMLKNETGIGAGHFQFLYFDQDTQCWMYDHSKQEGFKPVTTPSGELDKDFENNCCDYKKINPNHPYKLQLYSMDIPRILTAMNYLAFYRGQDSGELNSVFASEWINNSFKAFEPYLRLEVENQYWTIENPDEVTDFIRPRECNIKIAVLRHQLIKGEADYLNTLLEVDPACNLKALLLDVVQSKSVSCVSAVLERINNPEDLEKLIEEAEKFLKSMAMTLGEHLALHNAFIYKSALVNVSHQINSLSSFQNYLKFLCEHNSYDSIQYLFSQKREFLNKGINEGNARQLIDSLIDIKEKCQWGWSGIEASLFIILDQIFINCSKEFSSEIFEFLSHEIGRSRLESEKFNLDTKVYDAKSPFKGMSLNDLVKKHHLPANSYSKIGGGAAPQAMSFNLAPTPSRSSSSAAASSDASPQDSFEKDLRQISDAYATFQFMLTDRNVVAVVNKQTVRELFKSVVQGLLDNINKKHPEKHHAIKTHLIGLHQEFVKNKDLSELAKPILQEMISKLEPKPVSATISFTVLQRILDAYKTNSNWGRFLNLFSCIFGSHESGTIKALRTLNKANLTLNDIQTAIDSSENHDSQKARRLGLFGNKAFDHSGTDGVIQNIINAFG